MGIDPMQMKSMVIQGMIDSLDSKDKAEKLLNIDTLGKTIGIGAMTGLEEEALTALRRVYEEADDEIQSAVTTALTQIMANMADWHPGRTTSSFAVGDMSALFPMPAKPEEKKGPKTKSKIGKPLLIAIIIIMAIIFLCVAAGVFLFIIGATGASIPSPGF